MVQMLAWAAADDSRKEVWKTPQDDASSRANAIGHSSASAVLKHPGVQIVLLRR